MTPSFQQHEDEASWIARHAARRLVQSPVLMSDSTGDLTNHPPAAMACATDSVCSVTPVVTPVIVGQPDDEAAASTPVRFIPPWTRTERVGRIVAMVSAIGFVVLTRLISIPQIERVDVLVIRSLRVPGDSAHPIGPAWFVELSRDFTALGGYGILGTLTILVAIFLMLERRPRRAAFVGSVVVTAYVLSMLLKNLIGRPRPSIVPYLSFAHSESFPSGHSMMSAVVYLSLGLMVSDLAHRRIVKCFLIAAPMTVSACVGMSRVYMGVHYPTDVAAGWLAGVSWALLCWVVARRQRSLRALATDETCTATT